MNYENIRLDRNMYKYEIGFNKTLEKLDPSSQYSGTNLDGLDSFQRQLKRFDIKVNGNNSDTVSKFFQSQDSSILFPEYVCRCVKSGIEDNNMIKNIVASTIQTNSLDYRGMKFDTNEEETKLNLQESLVKMKKRGRLLSASYEAIKFQRLNVLTVALRQIGAYIAKFQLNDAIELLMESKSKIEDCNDLNYLDYIFDCYNLNTIIMHPKTAHDCIFEPEKYNVIKTDHLDFGVLICMDKNYALQMIYSGDVNVDYDKLINVEFERVAITSTFGFSIMFEDAIKIIRIY